MKRCGRHPHKQDRYRNDSFPDKGDPLIHNPSVSLSRQRVGLGGDPFSSRANRPLSLCVCVVTSNGSFYTDTAVVHSKTFRFRTENFFLSIRGIHSSVLAKPLCQQILDTQHHSDRGYINCIPGGGGHFVPSPLVGSVIHPYRRTTPTQKSTIQDNSSWILVPLHPAPRKTKLHTNHLAQNNNHV